MSDIVRMTLTEFLLARIAEDEADVSAVFADMSRWDNPAWSDENDVGFGMPAQVFTARMSPDRVLAECKAKRRIIDLANQASDLETQLGMEYGTWHHERKAKDVGEEILAELALPYADHPDYDESWRP